AGGREGRCRGQRDHGSDRNDLNTHEAGAECACCGREESASRFGGGVSHFLLLFKGIVTIEKAPGECIDPTLRDDEGGVTIARPSAPTGGDTPTAAASGGPEIDQKQVEAAVGQLNCPEMYSFVNFSRGFSNSSRVGPYSTRYPGRPPCNISTEKKAVIS